MLPLLDVHQQDPEIGRGVGIQTQALRHGLWGIPSSNLTTNQTLALKIITDFEIGFTKKSIQSAQ